MKTVFAIVALALVACGGEQAPEDNAAAGNWQITLDEPCGAGVAGASIGVLIVDGEYTVWTEGVYDATTIAADGDDAVLISTHYTATPPSAVTFHLEDDASAFTWDTDDDGCHEADMVFSVHTPPA